MKLKKRLFFLLFLLPIASQAQQYAPQQQQQQQATGGCSNYPYVAGATDVQMTDLGVKILSTGAASVDFDEPDEVQDAVTEATLEAKGVIAKFFNEDIKEEASLETLIKKATHLIRDASGTQEMATKNKIRTTLKKISSNSAAMLRGVVTLAQCYDKGSQVLVTVGLKPETIAAAEGLTRQIGTSMNRTPTDRGPAPGQGQGQFGGQPPRGYQPRGPESFSRGTDSLKDF